MKTYTIVTLNNKKYCYRVYGNRYGRTLELVEGEDTIRGKRVFMPIDGYEPNKLYEAADLLKSND